MSEMIFTTLILMFKRESESLHYLITQDGLRNNTQMFLKVYITPPFCIQFINGIQDAKPPGRQRNRLIDDVVKIIQQKKIKIYHTIYVNIFYNCTVSYLTVLTGDVINTTKNYEDSNDPNKFLKRHLRSIHRKVMFQNILILGCINFNLDSISIIPIISCSQ